MEWTREKPSKPGYYWLFQEHVRVALDKYENSCEIVEVREDDIDHEIAFFYCGSDDFGWPEKMDGLWYGPLEQPELPKGLVKENKLS